jgi:iron complex outermembrane receptor protein
MVTPSNVVAEPTKLEEVVVSSDPLPQTLLEFLEPSTVLSGKELQTKAQGSLGATLSSEAGVSASGFGPGASRPIIRGLGGDRVKILENGIGSQDVSNTSPDHLVTIDPGLINSVEVLRGPASLLYGTSAIGGLVNVNDNRILEELPSAPATGRVEVRGSTVDEERTGVMSVNAPAGPVAFHFDALKRVTDDIHIPGYARTGALRANGPSLDYPEPKGTLPFSSTDTDNLTFGTSYIKKSGFFGAAVSDFHSQYGVPNGENDVSIQAERKRLDARGKLFDPLSGIQSMDLKFGFIDYDHTEYQGDEAGTVFRNRAVETRYEAAHYKIAGFKGVAGLQHQYANFGAEGEEAFQPETTKNEGAAFFFEERDLSRTVQLQLSSRFDYQEIEAHSSEPLTRNFDTYSQSIGTVWSAVENYALSLTLANTQRAPSGQELFADGPHVATGVYEIGDENLDPEQSLGADLTLRRKAGKVTGSIGGFFNHFQNYITLVPTGETIDDLPVYQFTSTPADMRGFESQVAYHFRDKESDGDALSVDYQTDYVWAADRSTGEALPRIPPLRMKWGINYSDPALLDARLELQQVFSQERTQADETDTSGYTFLNLTLSKDVPFEKVKLTAFVRGTNLLNEKARDATSFIKDVAPLPGANVTTGVQFRF